MNIRSSVKFGVLAVVLIVALTVSTITTAQGDKKPETPGAGKGAPIVDNYFGSDPESLNPILTKTGTAAAVTALMYPGFIRTHWDTGLPTPDLPNALVKSYKVSDDGLVYTFTLREDMKWNDDKPITSADIKYAYDAIVSGDVDTNLRTPITTNIAKLETPDAKTVVITFKAADCAAIFRAQNLPVIPSHIYKEVYPTFKDMKPDNKYNLAPTVSGSRFKFQAFRPGEQVNVIADQNYKDSPVGHVIPEGYIYKKVSDQNVAIEQFLAGTLTWITSVPEARQAEMKQLGDQGKAVYREAPATTRHIIYFNLADPKNPKDGLDKDGKAIDQGGHPLFGDLRVRQAFAYGLDYSAINKGAFNDFGVAIGNPVLPTSWAYNSAVKPWPYDPEKAKKLLDEAGFVVDPKNPDGPRIANDKAKFAKPGTPLEFTFTAFSGNNSVDAATVLIQDQLKKIGFKVNLEVIEFQKMVEKLQGQTFDMLTVYLAMTPANPDSIFSQMDVSGDLVKSGLNAGSWNNPEFTDLMKKARNLKGCDLEERKKMYFRVQEIVHDELPWYFLNWSQVPQVYSKDLKNFDPKPFGALWNLEVLFTPAAK